MRIRSPLLCLCLTLVVSCATKARAPSETAATPAPPARMKDTPPEKRAALRAADPNVDEEGDEQRWGIEAARERKRQAEQQKQAGPAQAPAPPSPPKGPFDIRANDRTPASAQP